MLMYFSGFSYAFAVSKEMSIGKKNLFSYDPAPSCEPHHGASASSSGFGIILSNPSTIDDANGNSTGDRVKKLTTSAALGGSGLCQYISPASLTPELRAKELACPEKHFCYEHNPSCAPLDGAVALCSGFGFTPFNPNTIDDANGNGTGRRVNAQSTRTASGCPGPSSCTSPAFLTPEW